MRRMFLPFISVALATGFVACASAPAGTAPSGTIPTYRTTIAPLLEQRCAGCHVEGGNAPFALTSYSLVKSMSQAVLESVEARRMPPWLPSPDCHPVVDSRRMTDAEIATLKTWIQNGMPEGAGVLVRAQAPAATSRAFAPNVSGKVPTSYLSPDVDDDYRCFILAPQFPETVYETGIQVKPGNTRVHHALIYAVAGDQLAKATAQDGKDGQPGYPCFAGVVPGLDPKNDQSGASSTIPPLLGGWVPGMAPQLLPSGVGQRIRKGSRLIVQMHYSRVGGKPAADSTEVQVEATKVEPAKLVKVLSAVNFDIPVAAGEKRTHSVSYKYYNAKALTLRALAPHMHLLATSMRSDVVRANGEQACVIEIPRWDFHWQQAYNLPENDPIVVNPGDSLRLSCSFDNTAENQPVIDGRKQAPKNTDWGEGTGDEMCLLFASTIAPFTKEHAQACDPTLACATTKPYALRTLFGCAAQESECTLCEMRSALNCSGAACFSEFSAMRSCLTECAFTAAILGSNIGSCLADRCPSEYASAATCVDAQLGSATCAEELAKCGL